MQTLDLKSKNILFLVHSYNNFQKDQIESVAHYFKNVYVFVRYKPLVNFLNRFFRNRFANHTERYAIDKTNLPSNVNIYKIPLYYVPFGYFYKLLGYYHYFVVFKKVQSLNLHIDLIHAHFLWSSGFAATKLKEQLRIPCVITGHGYDVYDLPFKDNFWRSTIKSILDKADCVITVSDKNKTILQGLSSKLKVRVIPNGVKLENFKILDKVSARDALHIAKEKKVLLTVGRLEKIKGHVYLLDAVKKLVSTFPELYAIIVGSGSLRVFLERYADSLDMSDHVLFVSSVPQNDLLHYYNASDLVVIPSLRESFGLTALEAFACGKPVVATKNGGSEYLVTNNHLGYLCEPRNSENLSNKISSALSVSWKSSPMLAEARKYSWSTCSKKTLEVYMEVLTATSHQ